MANDATSAPASFNNLYSSLRERLASVSNTHKRKSDEDDYSHMSATEDYNEVSHSAHKSSNKNNSLTATRNLFESLRGHGALIAEILSYIIEDTKGLAHLRRVSKDWNATVRPHVWRSSFGFRRICAPSFKVVYCEHLVKYGEGTFSGRCYSTIPPEDNFSFFVQPQLGKSNEAEQQQPSAWASIQGMLICGDEEYGSDERRKTVKIDPSSGLVDKEGDYFQKNAEWFANQCKLITETKSWEEFQRLVDDAFTKGLFLCMEEREQASKTGHGIQMREIEAGFFLPVVLTVIIPQGNTVEVSQVGSTRIAYLKAKIKKDPDDDYHDFDDIIPFVAYWDNLFITRDGGDIDSPYFLYPTFAGYNVVLKEDGSLSCHVPLGILVNDGLAEAFFDWGMTDSNLPLDDLWRKSQEQHVREGVAIADDFVPKSLHNSLMSQINLLLENKVVDYHPHSNGIVRDIVHPALYSYVKGVSPLLKSEEEIKALSHDPDIPVDSRIILEPKDYWGRKYEASAKYQWLPTYFDIGIDGSCTICDYINNLVPRQQHEELYDSLAHLFSQALPLIESVYGYCRVVKEQHIRMETNEPVDYSYNSVVKPIEEEPVSLRGKQLQVVTKIVDYELWPGETYEGVWHVEGMSHEEIVATAIYFIDRDEEIEGGDILFKRAFHKQEANYIFSRVDQVRPRDVELIIDAGLQPIGHVKTLQGRLLAFPNSHVHKVTELKNTSTDCGGKKKRRRIIVFFLINPERRIISTREVPVQQEHAGGAMKRNEALEYRLELMKERKYTKQDWNVREIELCEH